jgi:tetratricopeptide (TPR) repeat protein
VLEIKPTSKFSHFYVGLAYARLGKSDEAMTHLREYLVRETTPPESLDAYEHAEKVFQNLRKGYTYVDMLEFDDTASNYYDLGRTAYEKGDYFRAIHFLRQAVDLAPGSFSSNYLMGLSYRHVGDRERAVFHLSRALYSVEAEKYSDKTLKKVEDLLNSLSKNGE